MAATVYFSEIARERPKLQRRNAVRGESPDPGGDPLNEATKRSQPPQGQTLCGRGHALTRTTHSDLVREDPGYADGYNCNLCKRGLKGPVYHCSACLYDACPACYHDTMSPELRGQGLDPASLAQALKELADLGVTDTKVITQVVCVGSKIDAQDRLGNWYSAMVLEADPGRMKVGFDGWAPKHDEWIPSDSERIKPFMTMADGGKEVTCDCLGCNWQRYLRASCERSEALTADLVDRIAAGEIKTTEDLEKWRRGDQAAGKLRSLLEVIWPSYDPEKKGRLRKKMAEQLLVDYLKALSNKRVLHTVLYRMMTCTVMESAALKYPQLAGKGKVEERVTKLTALSTCVILEEIQQLLRNTKTAASELRKMLDMDGDGTVSREDFLKCFPSAISHILNLRDTIMYSRSSCG